jgi:hypothetical protein
MDARRVVQRLVNGETALEIARSLGTGARPRSWMRAEISSSRSLGLNAIRPWPISRAWVCANRQDARKRGSEEGLSLAMAAHSAGRLMPSVPFRLEHCLGAGARPAGFLRALKLAPGYAICPGADQYLDLTIDRVAQKLARVVLPSHPIAGHPARHQRDSDRGQCRGAAMPLRGATLLAPRQA